MLGITRRDRKRNTCFREQTRIEDIIVKVKGLKWRWAGHIARRTDQRWTTEILNWIPRGHRRPRKRPQSRWVDEIRKEVGVTWKRIAQDRLVFKAFVETFIQQWIDNG